MVTTSRLRREYPDLIVSTSGPRCDYSTTVPVLFPSSLSPTGRVALKVHPLARQAFRALAAVMLAYGYTFDEWAGGTLNCRYIGGTSSTSLHAHGIAGDWNPSKNRYRVQTGPVQWGRQTDMPREMVRAIERLRTASGAVLIQWGGRWSNIKDPMHYELECLRRDLRTGVNLATLPAGSWARYLAFEKGTTPTEGDEVHLPLVLGDGYDSVPDWTNEWQTSGDRPTPGEDRSRKIEDVRDLQDRLNKLGAGLTLDGLYGPATKSACASVGGGWTGHADGKAGRWWGGNQNGELDWEIALEAARRAGGGGDTVDTIARDAAAAAASKAQSARAVADEAKAGAARANTTLDKIRSE